MFFSQGTILEKLSKMLHSKYFLNTFVHQDWFIRKYSRIDFLSGNPSAIFKNKSYSYLNSSHSCLFIVAPDFSQNLILLQITKNNHCGLSITFFRRIRMQVCSQAGYFWCGGWRLVLKHLFCCTYPGASPLQVLHHCVWHFPHYCQFGNR